MNDVVFALGLSLLALEPEPAHLVGTGGAIGAICRHWVYLQLSSEKYPIPTFLVNVVGSFGLGLLAFGGASESTVQLLGLGACGAFTTFSSFSVETVQIWERGDRVLAVLVAVGNLAGALAGVALAWGLVGALA
ncbi:fluoride efflux transporter FluC [Natrarchaeobaculum aegyptiacum]|uniref:Fluoride-specific ion channel FluC n=1 Tax=Natrarchaeobaculum aegyptiacum TaxID=745377 RepID=A0A2Z2HSI4_9EURY|nr:CrcB family protein [Natrarchaeobaculum aegyptiacum]ARS90130.1 chromosome condensation protein CrcB [Natrarchaeobaculum aegyptiacum]